MKKILLFLFALLATTLIVQADEATPRTFALVGAFNAWDNVKAPEFEQQEDGTYKIEVANLKAGGFKILEGHDWSCPQYASSGASVIPGEEFKLQQGGDNLVVGNGIVDYKDCTITLREEGDDLIMMLTGTAGDVTVTSWSLVGQWDGWNINDPNAVMTKVSDTEFYIEFAEFSGEFGIYESGNWNTGFKGNGSGVKVGEEYTLGQGANLIVEDGKVITDCKVTFKIYNDKCTILVTGTFDADDVYSLAGGFNGWDPTSVVFTEVSAGVHELILEVFAGEFKILKNGLWAGSLSTNGSAVVVGETYNPLAIDGSNMWIEGVSEDAPLTNCKFTLVVTDEQPELVVTGTLGAEKVAKDAVKVAVNGGVISVAGVENVAIYNAAGALVSTSAQANVPVGLYIVKAGKNVQKVIVK